jgi:tripartite ATP-independent transporter DctM subunit
MEWWLVLLFFIGGMIFVLLTGFPVAFTFLLIDLIGILIFLGPEGLPQFALQIYQSVSRSVLAPIPLFILMGELLFHSGIAYKILDALDQWLWKIPGRLAALAVTSGVLFAAMSGSSIANTAMLGTVLVPDMRRRGYKPSMSMGPILGAGGLAILIPPSGLAVVLASVANISVAKLLIGGVIPGLILGAAYFAYIVIRCLIDPSQAPTGEPVRTSLQAKIVSGVKYVLPTGIVIFSVLGFILLGLATPSEAAASGVIGTLILISLYGRLNWGMIKKSAIGSLEVTVMVFMIIAASDAYASVLAYTGAIQGLLDTIQRLQIPPMAIMVGMQLSVIIMGFLMESVSIMMIALPIFMPIVKLLGFDPIWFGCLFLVNIELGLLTPPFGMLLFVMKGVVPDVNMKEVMFGALPFMLIELGCLILMLLWPALVLWLPSMVSG